MFQKTKEDYFCNACTKEADWETLIFEGTKT